MDPDKMLFIRQQAEECLRNAPDTYAGDSIKTAAANILETLDEIAKEEKK